MMTTIPIRMDCASRVQIETPRDEAVAVVASLQGGLLAVIEDALRLEEARATSKMDRMQVRHLGWSESDAGEARSRLISFESDWNAPGMGDYDQL